MQEKAFDIPLSIVQHKVALISLPERSCATINFQHDPLLSTRFTEEILNEFSFRDVYETSVNRQPHPIHGEWF
jgi:hypothetical protein